MCATADAPLGERGKSALHLIKLRGRRRRELHIELCVACPLDFGRLGRLVRAIVVHHQMDFQIICNVGFDGMQELQELATVVASVGFIDHLTGGNSIKRRKQSRRAVALVVVCALLR